MVFLATRSLGLSRKLASDCWLVVVPSFDSNVITFALERPPLRARRRDQSLIDLAIPYFVSGEENRLASFVASSDAAYVAGTQPILLVGPSGSGKTALALHLAARLFTMSSGGSSSSDANAHWTGYWQSTDLARYYAECVDADDMDPLRRQLAETPVLVIDDLQTIADKTAAQEELAIRINDRILMNRPTILTCRRMPSDVRGLRPSLVSRSLPGLTISLRCPSLAARRLIVRELALEHDVLLDSCMTELLATGFGEDVTVRQLQAAVMQLVLWTRMNDSPLSLEAVQSVVSAATQQRTISMSDITRAVGRHFRLRATELRSDSRLKSVVRARSLAMWLARKVTSLSLSQIGAEYGGRDHTTVLHGIRKTESLLESDVDLRRAADEILEKLAA